MKNANVKFDSQQVNRAVLDSVIQQNTVQSNTVQSRPVSAFDINGHDTQLGRIKAISQIRYELVN
jgi:hypothetical protein